MTRLTKILSLSAFLFALSMIGATTSALAEDLELCPDGYSQGVVTTGAVECVDESSRRSQREDAEEDRLESEAVCNSTPNSEITSSQIIGTSSGGFISIVTCTITRPTPAGTVFCPNDTEEVYRAFDTLVCKDFGSAVGTMAEAQASLGEQTTACTTGAAGQVLESGIEMGTVLDDVPFFYSTVACRLQTIATDNIECPFSFNQFSSDEDELECNLNRREYESLAEAEQANMAAQSLCTDTTAGLGSVTNSSTGITSSETFFSNVDCTVSIPRYSDFADSNIIRACDTSCTEEVQQARTCLNGGQIGGPGCIAPSTQVITRKCNTGTQQGGACPLVITPTTVVPLLLDDDD